MTTLKERPGSSGGCLCGAVRYAIRGPLRPTAVVHDLPQVLWRPVDRQLRTPRRRAAVVDHGRLAVHSWTAESADYWSFDPGIPRKPGPSGLRGP